MTAQELSEKLEVSVRTVFRDVDSLSAAGVPICAAQGKGGGVYLMEGYVLERAAFTEEEQRQLLTALRALPGEEGDALGKLSALFRREGDDWLQVQLSRWGGQSGRDGETFQALRQAIRQQTEFYLLCMPGDKPFKTKYLSAQIGSARLSFAPEDKLWELLRCTPGSATILGLMNDTEHRVHLLIDRPVYEAEYLSCHPCICTSSLKLRTRDVLTKLLPHTGHTPQIVDLPDTIE